MRIKPFHSVLVLLVIALAALSLPALALDATWNAATDVPVTAAGYTASGLVNLSLNFAPPVGTSLTVVKSPGAPINGTFLNLQQGQLVNLSYGGKNYCFIPNYYGGAGSDLVLQWPNVRACAWASNQSGQLGDNATVSSSALTSVLQSGILSGQVVTAVAAGENHSLALCADGTLAAWGDNQYGELGNNSTTNSSQPVVSNQLGVLAGKSVVAVSAGENYSLALCSDGTVAAWGANNYGQLGNNSTTMSKVPIAVVQTGVLAGKRVVAISAGMYHSLALCSDGTVATWGYNGSGQLGNGGGFQSSSVPVAVPTNGVLAGKTVVAISAGIYHSLALCSDGTLAAWGSNWDGELGNGSTGTSSYMPVAVVQTGVLAGKTVVAVSAGQFHSLALCADGTVAAWGDSQYGQLGNGSTGIPSNVPVAVVQTSGVLAGKIVVAISAGQNHSVALCSDGTLATWGSNSAGQLGNNSIFQNAVPALARNASLAPGECFVAAVSGSSASHTLALVASPLHSNANLAGLAFDNGALHPAFASGTTSYTATTTITMDPTRTPFGATTTAELAIRVIPYVADNTATVTVNGEPVDGSANTMAGIAPQGTTPITIVVTAQDGTTTTYTVNMTDGPLSWTYNSPFDVPDAGSAYVASGAATLSLNFAPVPGTNLTVVKNMGRGFISGTFSNLAQGQFVTLSYAGLNYRFRANYYGGTGSDLVLEWANVRPVAWGSDTRGQLGNGESPGYSRVPDAVLQSSVLAGKTITAMSAGDSHTLALCSDGTVAAWGSNSSGQLGNNSTVDSNVPVAVDQTGVLAGKTVIAVAAGSAHSLALCSDGTIAAWGSDSNGQLGDNNTGQSTAPVAVVQNGVLAGAVVTGIAAGGSHSLALSAGGGVVAWGSNSYGQLGNNTLTDSHVPVGVVQSWGLRIVPGKIVVAIAAGLNHSLALNADGTVSVWGQGLFGQMGIPGNNTANPLPVVVPTDGVLSGKMITAISAGQYHNLVLCSDGTIATWGETGTSSNTVSAATAQTSGALAGRTVVAIQAGANHDLALCSDGTLAAWGDNTYGQLGIDSMTSSSLPALVSTSTLAAGETFASESSGQGANHTLALVAEPPAAPLVATLAATSIGSTGATLNGVLNGIGNSITVSFDFGTDTSYGFNLTATPGTITGTNPTAVSAALTGLMLGTTYHFRLAGTTGAGIQHGADFTFTTPASPQDWRSRWYGTTADAGVAAGAADPYGTGISNLLSFALLGPAQDPGTASVAQLPQMQTSGASLFISFNQPPGVTGVTYGVEWSATLQGDWQPVPDTGTRLLHIFSMPVGNNPQLFMRLNVTEP